MTAPACLRADCEHLEDDHDSETGYCMECSCTGFLSEETFDAAEDIAELELGSDER